MLIRENIIYIHNTHEGKGGMVLCTRLHDGVVVHSPLINYKISE